MDISVKKTFIIIQFLLFFLIGCSIVERDTDEIVINVGNFSVDQQQYESQLKKLATTHNELTEKEAALFLLDNYISAGLLVEGAKKLNYDQQDDFIKRDSVFKEELVLKYNKYLSTNTGKPPYVDEFIIDKILQNEIWIDYIRIPKEYKEISKTMFEYLVNKMRILDILNNPKIEEWNNKELSFYENILLRHAILTDKVIEEIITMQDEEVRIIKTHSAYYIVRFLRSEKIFNPDVDDNESILLNLLRAQSLEKGDTIFDPYRLEKSIKCNEELLSKIDFSIEPFHADDNFVANICGQFISENEIKEKISELPVKVQSLFVNKTTRIRAVATLVLLDYYQCQEEKEEEKIEKTFSPVDNKLQEILFKAIREIAAEDTISFLKGWITNEFEKYNTHATLDNSIPIQIKDKGNKKTLRNNKKPEKVSGWLQPHKMNGYNQLKFDFGKIEEMEIPQNNIIDDQILAYSDNWNMTVKDLKKELDQLTPTTRLTIANNNLLCEMIEYLAKRNSVLESKLVVNSNLFESIDIMGKSYDQLNYVFSENAVIGTLEHIDLSVKELRESIVKLSEQEKNKFLNVSRKEVFNEIITEKFWRNPYDRKKIEDNPDFKKEILDYQNKLLVELLYESKLRVNVPQIANESLNLKMQLAVKSINADKLLACIQTTMQDYPIQVDSNFFQKKFNLNIESSKYHKVIIKNIN